MAKCARLGSGKPGQGQGCYDRARAEGQERGRHGHQVGQARTWQPPPSQKLKAFWSLPFFPRNGDDPHAREKGIDGETSSVFGNSP